MSSRVVEMSRNQELKEKDQEEGVLKHTSPLTEVIRK
jgi:hypothetical protein